MKTLTAYPSEQQPLGFFRIFATPPGGFQREITLFRGAPIKMGTISTQDPFTEVTAGLSFPQITVWDSPGEGDLDWLVANTDIDIVWQNMAPYDYDWRWEGYIASYSFTMNGQESSFSTDLKGALYGLDDYLAIPQFPKRPIPYEILIAQAFDQDEHPAHLGKFQIRWPSDWKEKDEHVVPAWNDPVYLSALKPWGVATGQAWTGFTSRSTGTWEPLLTGHVQSMLTHMFAEGGSQWSVRNLGHRRPELFLRRVPDSSDDAIIEITLGAPGVTFDGSRDFTQRAGVIYGAGQDEAGLNFSNIVVSPDGKTTYYKPYAYSGRLWPRKGNPNYDPDLKPKETMIKFQDGVDEVSAMKIALGQYQRFAEPGITGSITLTTDPRTSSGKLMPRLMIRGGQTIRINGLFGVREGVLAHITQVSADFDALTTTLTFDTKYRDQLTVEEVRARTRDALTPMRALQVGKYSNTIQDLILPWTYAAGSGMVPLGAKEFFNEKLPTTAVWPYEEFTRKFPPKDNPTFYIKINPTDRANSDNNWSNEGTRDGIPLAAVAFRAAQNGTIKLTQLAAYDKNGNVMPVKFHFSFYSGTGLAPHSMPKFPVPPGDPMFPKYLAARRVDGTTIPTTYGTFQAHPFYEGGWETVQPNGTEFPWGGDPQLTNPGSGLIVGYGNYFEPAGYWPGRASKGAARTGLYQDDQPWSFDLSEPLDKNNPTTNRDVAYAGMLFVMIYCDDQDDKPVYFMGRLVRQEPGQS